MSKMNSVLFRSDTGTDARDNELVESALIAEKEGLDTGSYGVESVSGTFRYINLTAGHSS